MARPCKPATLLKDRSLVKGDLESREKSEKMLKGNPAKLRPPAYLSAPQKKIFKRLVGYLNNADILGEQDVDLLSLCATAIDRIRQIEAAINNDPGLVTDARLATVRKGYEQTFFRTCNELGLSPQSRAKLGNIALQKQQEAADPVLSLIQGGASK